MKKVIFSALVFMFSFIVLYSLFSNRSIFEERSELANTVTANEKLKKIVTMKELIKKENGSMKNNSLEEFSLYVKKIQESTSDDLIKSEIQKSFLECSKDFNSDKCEDARESIELFKALISAKGKDAREMTRLEVVATIIYPLIQAEGDITKVDFKKTAAFAREAIKADDSFYIAHKLNFTMEVLDIVINKSKSLTGFEESLKGVKTFDYLGEDSQVSDAISISYAVAENPKGMKQYIEEIRELKPHSGLAQYYNAMRLNVEKKYDQSYKQLLAALEQDPYNEKFLAAKKSRKSNGEMSFSVSLTVSPADL